MTAFAVPGKLFLGTAITLTDGTGGELVAEYGDEGFRIDRTYSRLIHVVGLNRKVMRPVGMGSETEIVAQLRTQQDSIRKFIFEQFRNDAEVLHSDESEYPRLTAPTQALFVPHGGGEDFFFAPNVSWSPRNDVTPTQLYEDKLKYDDLEVRFLCARPDAGGREWAEGTEAKVAAAIPGLGVAP